MSTTVRRLHFLRRDQQHTAPYVRPGIALPPADLFPTDAAATIRTQERLVAAWRRHEAEATRCRAESDQAAQDYADALRGALENGKPAETVTDKSPALRAQAQAHDELAEKARREATAHGHTTGKAIADNAEHAIAQAEQTMDTEAENVREAVASLRGAWATWSGAWATRRLLGGAVLFGGSIDQYRDAVPLPADVAQALATLEDHLNSLPRLRSDEAAVLAWRAEQERAQAANEAQFVGRPARRLA